MNEIRTSGELPTQFSGRGSTFPSARRSPADVFKFSVKPAPVAQTCCLLYRRFLICRPPQASDVPPIPNRRHSRLKICVTLNTYPPSGSTAIELRSADFSPHPSSPAKTAGSGLKSALLSCRNSLNSTAVPSGRGRILRCLSAQPRVVSARRTSRTTEAAAARSLCPRERVRVRGTELPSSGFFSSVVARTSSFFRHSCGHRIADA